MAQNWYENALNISKRVGYTLLHQCSDCLAVEQRDRTWQKGPPEKIEASHGRCPDCEEKQKKALKEWQEKRKQSEV